ncbi:MAG TPA: exodeoxyribonuclease VII small subunit [Beijerinckiaceae bacterium]|jgi:exodeoxyribonuclease VII small subunit
MATNTAQGAGTAPDVASLPFEKALDELEQIVKRLERGEVPLEESIAIYERGEALKKHCEALLKRAEARIEKITIGPGGEPTGTTPLDPGT